MSREKHPSQHTTGLARFLLFVVFVILCAGHYAFWEFGFYKGKPNPSLPAMPGLVIGAALASTVMIGAIWIRKGLARTALIVFNWIMMFIFSIPGLIMLSDRSSIQMGALTMLGAGMVAYLLGNIILIVSTPIHRLGMPRGCRS